MVVTFPGHDRDAAWFATLYGVPVYLPSHLPPLRFDARVERVAARVPDSPLQLVPSNGHGLLGWFRDTAVWWPARRALAIGDTLGTATYFLLPGESLAVHPVRRLQPPTELLTLIPERIYGGHGPSVTADAAAALAEAVRTSRSRLWPSWQHAIRLAWTACAARSARPAAPGPSRACAARSSWRTFRLAMLDARRGSAGRRPGVGGWRAGRAGRTRRPSRRRGRPTCPCRLPRWWAAPEPWPKCVAGWTAVPCACSP